VKEKVTQRGETPIINSNSTDDEFGTADFDYFSEDHTGYPDEVVPPADDQRSSLKANNSTNQYPDAAVPDPVTLPKVGITTPSRPPNAGQFTRAGSTGPTTASNACQGTQPPTGHNQSSSSPEVLSRYFNHRLPQHQYPPSNAAPHIPPVGFYSARAATHVNSDSNAVIPSNVPKFDLHRESPSIRKTPNIIHNKTVPVKRSFGGTPVVASPTVRDVVPPRTNPPTNFVDPSSNMYRLIGAPKLGGRNTGTMPRSAYRSPTRRGPDPSVAGGGGAQNNSTVKRPPLGDISNVHQPNTGAAGESDAKRQRISGPENSTMSNHATSAK
jgi:DNA repair and recombination protein RAD52